jgi:predicted TIM-barrel fold metal-dependent hydrolase
VIESERPVEVANADGDVVEVDRFEVHERCWDRHEKNPLNGASDPEIHHGRDRPRGMASEPFAPAIDGHTHLMPERLMGAIRGALAEQAGWQFNHPTAREGMERQFRAAGVERYLALPYAHKPGMAAELNDWLLDRAAESNMIIPFATVHGDDDVATVVEAAFAAGARGLKFQCPVQECGPADPRLDPAFELAAEYDRPILFHAGTAPLYEDSPHVGIEQFEAFTKSYPRVRAACAHMGAFQSEEFLALVADHENAFLDTSFAMSTEATEHLGRALDIADERLEALSASIFYGSDYPNIPYPYEAERAGLLERNLPESAFRDIFARTAERFLGER